ncbi:MAG: hypothetical protein IIY55_00550 [Blautia sp.]|nr:hypothetical protein [Blautia sp.]
MENKYIFRIKLAGRLIEIRSLHETCRIFCKEYLAPEEEQGPPVFLVDIVPRNIMRENDAAQGCFPVSDEEIYHYFDPGYLETGAVHRKICENLPRFDTFLMHGAVAAYEGSAYMFTAPSGTGKTTRAELWLKEFPGSFIVNGDKPLIRLDSRRAYACGTPWSGKEHWNVNTAVPLQAVFLLERTEPGEKSSLEAIDTLEGYFKLLEQTYKPERAVSLQRTLLLLKSLEGRVKIYRFRSPLSGEGLRAAWETAKPR